jgi:tetratricopeptide (TPR) repeat protein
VLIEIGKAMPNIYTLIINIFILVLFSYSNTSQAACTYFNEFKENGDGTVTDPRNGLVWQKCALGQTWSGSACSGQATPMFWEQAMQAAQENRFLGKNNWRLPRLSEFRHVIGDDGECAYEKRAVSSRLSYPISDDGRLGNDFWASTTMNYATQTDERSPTKVDYYAAAVSLENGGFGDKPFNSQSPVRLVRNGERTTTSSSGNPASPHKDSPQPSRGLCIIKPVMNDEEIELCREENKKIVAPVENNDSHSKAGMVPEKSQLARPLLDDAGKFGAPFKSGMEAFQNEQYSEAVKFFKIAVAQEPKASAPLYFLGASLAKSGNTGEAQCSLAKALVLPENNGSDSNRMHAEPIAALMRELSAKFSPPTAAQCNHLDKETATLAGRDLKSLQENLKSCDPKVAVSAAEAILGNPENLKEPLELFSPAAVLFQQGKKDDAVFWFYAAQLRTRYQLVFEKGDRGQLLSIMMMTVGVPINNYALQDVSNLHKILDRVLEWDKRTPNPFRNKPRTEETDKQIEKIYAGLEKLKAKLIAEKSELESKARAAAPMIEQSYAQQANTLCGKGQIDPADANQIVEREWLQVMDFVKSNKDVIKEVGTIKGVGRESSTKKQGEIIPSRYIASVGGDRSAYAVIDVSRISGDSKFSLACLTHLSLGQRDPFKDVCKQ